MKPLVRMLEWCPGTATSSTITDGCLRVLMYHRIGDPELPVGDRRG